MYAARHCRVYLLAIAATITHARLLTVAAVYFVTTQKVIASVANVPASAVTRSTTAVNLAMTLMNVN